MDIITESDKIRKAVDTKTPHIKGYGESEA